MIFIGTNIASNTILKSRTPLLDLLKLKLTQTVGTTDIMDMEMDMKLMDMHLLFPRIQTCIMREDIQDMEAISNPLSNRFALDKHLLDLFSPLQLVTIEALLL